MMYQKWWEVLLSLLLCSALAIQLVDSKVVDQALVCNRWYSYTKLPRSVSFTGVGACSDTETSYKGAYGIRTDFNVRVLPDFNIASFGASNQGIALKTARLVFVGLFEYTDKNGSPGFQVFQDQITANTTFGTQFSNLEVDSFAAENNITVWRVNTTSTRATLRLKAANKNAVLQGQRLIADGLKFDIEVNYGDLQNSLSTGIGMGFLVVTRSLSADWNPNNSSNNGASFSSNVIADVSQSSSSDSSVPYFSWVGQIKNLNTGAMQDVYRSTIEVSGTWAANAYGLSIDANTRVRAVFFSVTGGSQSTRLLWDPYVGVGDPADSTGASSQLVVAFPALLLAVVLAFVLI